MANCFQIKNILFAVLLIFYCLLPDEYCFAQPTYKWAKGMGGPLLGLDIAFNMAVDGSGNTYIVGIFQNTADFDPGPATANLTSAGNDDIFLAKYDANGNYLWANRIGGTLQDRGEDITVDASGNVYISGFFSGTVDFDPSGGITNLVSNGGWDFFFAKYDTGGNFIWAKGMGGFGNDECTSIALDVAGNIHITGDFNSTVDFDPGASIVNLSAPFNLGAFFAKYDNNGNYVWAKSIGGDASSACLGYSLKVDGSGNVCIIGFFEGTADFDPGAGVTTLTAPVTNQDFFFAKYDLNGNYLWAKSVGDVNSDDFGLGIVPDVSGNIYITGCFPGTANFNPSGAAINLTSAGSYDIFFGKYDGTTGSCVWAERMGSVGDDESHNITLDAVGNIYITNAFQNTVDFDPGAGTANLTAAGVYDFFFAKYDNNGNYIWAKEIGAPLSDDEGTDIVVDCSGSIYTTGIFQNTADFDPDQGVANVTSNGDYDIFIAKYIPIAVSANATICTGTSQSLTASGADSFLWSPSASLNSSTNASVIASPTVTTTYTVTGTTVGFCAPQTIQVTIATMGGVIASSAASSICSGNSTTLSASGSDNYIWNPAASLSSPTGAIVTASPTVTTTYTVTETTCNISTTVTILIGTSSLPTLVLSSGATICSENSTILSVTGASNYVWFPSATLSSNTGYSVSASPFITTSYTVIGTALSGCYNSATTTVNLSPPITLILSPSQTICEGVTVPLTVSGTNAYTWSPASGISSTVGNAISFNDSLPGSYSYTVTGYDNNNCSKSGNLKITVHSLPTLFGTSNATICVGNTMTLSVTGAVLYRWSPSAGLTTTTGSSIVTSTVSNITYTLTGIDVNGCVNQTMLSVSVLSLPTITTSPDETICKGNTVSLSASGANTYIWFSSVNLSNSQTITDSPTTNTTYTVIGTDLNGCINTAVVKTSIASPVVTTSPGEVINQGESANISASGNGISYEWMPPSSLSCSSCSSTIASPSETTKYYVIMTDSYGCQSRDSLLITINEICGELFIPDAFSPNGDGENDVLYVKIGNNNCIQSMSFEIYDRLGIKVFSSDEPSNGWDGRRKGKECNTGVFVYNFHAKLADGTTVKKKGNISLLR